MAVGGVPCRTLVTTARFCCAPARMEVMVASGGGIEARDDNAERVGGLGMSRWKLAAVAIVGILAGRIAGKAAPKAEA